MKTLGQVAFEAYNTNRGGMTHDGKRTPPWEELGEGVRAGWEAAAEAAREGAAAGTHAAGAFREWALLELMGHRRFAGLVQDVEVFGRRLVRLDIPSEPPVTQFYGADAVYCVTPVGEETARAFAKNAIRPQPISRYELVADTPHPAAPNDDDWNGPDDFPG